MAFLIEPQSLFLLKQEITLLLILVFIQLCLIQSIFFHQRDAQKRSSVYSGWSCRRRKSLEGLWWKNIFRAIQLFEGVAWVSKPPEDSQSPSLSYQVSLASLYSDNIILLIKPRQNFVISSNSLLNFRLTFPMNAMLPDTLLRGTGKWYREVIIWSIEMEWGLPICVKAMLTLIRVSKHSNTSYLLMLKI